MSYRVRQERDVVSYIRERAQAKNPLYLYAGAGVSAEADVLTANAICNQILEHFTALEKAAVPPPPDPAEAARQTLRWHDESKRYARCIEKRYPTLANRVDFFRDILRSRKPSFGHHAIAMLMKRGYLQSTCITTNFDKLIEAAFIHQRSECQAIRTPEEIRYFERVPGRYFVIKLHGDYDTNNVANTSKETTILQTDIIKTLKGILQHSGMLVLGAAGNEPSVVSMFNEIMRELPDVLKYGLLWGVYMGQRRPSGLSDSDVESLLRKKLENEKVVSAAIVSLMESEDGNPNFSFFPVWGSGQVLLDLINGLGNLDLAEESEPYLDLPMRLRKTFSKLTETAIDKHLSSLDIQQKAVREKGILRFDPSDHCICKAQGNGFPVRVTLIYADVMAMPLMRDAEFDPVKRAVISPEDTCISAGGGVAYSLVDRAGSSMLLHELAKFKSTPQRSIVVTSAGQLPIHYIFHAAAMEIMPDGQYSVTTDDIRGTMANALRMASAMSVAALWTPLIGAGLAAIPPEESLKAILETVACPEFHNTGPLSVIVMIYKEKMISRQTVLTVAKQALSDFTVAGYAATA